jgi:hypothetical protein
MKVKLAFVLALAAVAASAFLVSASGVAASNGNVASATGAGQLNLPGGFRNFSFTARKASDGTVSGQAQLDNRAQGVREHIAIDCLVVSGNQAWVGGTVTDSTSTTQPVGTVGVFYAQDNGEGANAPPDRISLFTSFSPVLTCTNGFAQSYTLATALPIDEGNIQIH